MEEVDRDIQEMKRLKKKQLVHYNFGMLLLMVLFAYFVRNGGSANLLLGLCCALFWIFAAGMLYTLKTGKVLGPKSSRRVQAFDRDRLGEKRWKRKNTLSAVFLCVLSVGFTVMWLAMDFDSVRLEFPFDAIPFIGSWLGFNIGEGIRISKL